MKKDIIKDTLFITIGGFLVAFGITYFYQANDLAGGGITGISLILYYLFEINMSLSYAIINIPLIILGYKYIGGNFIIRTLYGTLATTIGMWLMGMITVHPLEDKLVAGIFGGVIIGLGGGAMFQAGGSSGGTDILVKIVNKYYEISMGNAYLLLNSVILSLSGFFFGLDIFLYTLVGMYTSMKVIDVIQDGFHSSKSITIISDKSIEIKNKIIKDLNRGATIINVQGGYKEENKKMISCIVSRYEVISLKRMIRSIDDKAFVYITDVAEVLGQGFKDLKQ